MEVASVERCPKSCDVYDIAVEGSREFFANGILVHNCDELGAWENPEEVWLQLQLATRVRGPMGDDPQFVVTTTPRSIPLLKALLKDPDTRVSRASTFANAANLSAEALRALKTRYEGTSIGRQELHGELLEDVDETLWRRSWIDAARVRQAPPDLARVIVGVDPAVTSGDGSAETGIIVAGKDATGHAYVLADCSLKAMPDVWARRAVAAYHEHKADRVIAEANNGGDLVINVLRTADPAVPVTKVHAARGKQTRAEPVSALYQQGRVHHVGPFPVLEDQLCGWVPGDAASPDRLDALVWALSELMLGHQFRMPQGIPIVVLQSEVLRENARSGPAVTLGGQAIVDPWRGTGGW